MLYCSEPRGIGRGEVAESRLEVPFFAAFLVFASFTLFITHTYLGNPSVTIGLAISMTVFAVTVVRVDLGIAILVMSALLSPEMDLSSQAEGPHRVEVRYNDALIVVIFLGVLVKTAFSRGKMLWRPSPINVGIVLYFMVCIMSTLLAVRANLPAWDRRMAFFVMLKMLEFYMIFIMVATGLETTKQVHTQLKLFFMVALIVCGFCMFTMRTEDRVGTPFEAGGSEPNTLGGYLTLIMCVAMGLFTQAPTYRKKLLFAAITAAAFIPFLYTLSRASYIALIVAMVAMFAISRRWIIAISVSLILILSSVLMPQPVKERVNYTFQQGEGVDVVIGGREMGFQVDKSTHERIYVWEKVRFLLTVAPWFGGGIAWETVLDSQYARVIMETGLIGLAMFLFMQFQILRTCRQGYLWSRNWVNRGLAMGAMAATVGLMTHSLGTISFLIIRIMEPYWFIIAVTVVVRDVAIREYRQEMEQQQRAKDAETARIASSAAPTKPSRPTASPLRPARYVLPSR